MKRCARLALLAISMMALANCNAILGLDAIPTVGDAGVDAAPDAPLLPDAPTEPLAAPIITSAAGTVTSPTPTIEGDCLAGALVAVAANALPWCDTTCTPGARFACAPATAQPDGPYVVVASQTLGAQTSPPSASVQLDINTLVSPGPTIAAPANHSLLGATAAAAVVVQGACTTGATVTVSDNATVFCTTPCAGAAYACSASAFGHGTHVLVAGQTGTTATTSVTFTVDNIMPGAPTMTNPSGAIKLNAATGANLNVNGACGEAGATVTVSNGGAATPSCAATCTGTSYSCTLTALANGTYAISARLTDLAGNVGDPSSPARSVTVDTTIPLAPVIDAPTAQQQLPSGLPTFVGTCEAGATVVAKPSVSGTAYCTAPCVGGTFSCTKSPPALTDGTHLVVASQTDAVNNPSPYTPPVAFVVNTWDDDGDGHPDVADNCPPYQNPDQALTDQDGDGVGDECDPSAGDGGTAQSSLAYLPFRTTLEYLGWNPTGVELFGNALGASGGGTGSLYRVFAGGVGALQTDYYFFPENNTGSLDLILRDQDGSPVVWCTVARTQVGSPETTVVFYNGTDTLEQDEGALFGPMRLAISSTHASCQAIIQAAEQALNLLSPFAPGLGAEALDIRLTGAARLRYLLVLQND